MDGMIRDGSGTEEGVRTHEANFPLSFVFIFYLFIGFCGGNTYLIEPHHTLARATTLFLYTIPLPTLYREEGRNTP